jgi:hypothetical protein
MWAKCQVFVQNFPVLAILSSYKTGKESKQLAMSEA